MRIIVAAAIAMAGAALLAQETKPVPKGSVRVSIPGCTHNYIFTAVRRTQDEPGSVDVPEGMHIRMNGSKDLIKEIRAHEGSRIVITGLMKKGQFGPDGIGLGGGVRVGPGPTNGMGGAPVGNQAMIDVEGWRPANGDCPTK
jgi:hypothetical protein